MFIESSSRSVLNNLCKCACTCQDDIIKVVGSQFVAYANGSPFGKIDLCDFAKQIGVVSKSEIAIKPKDFVILRLEESLTQFLLLKAHSINERFHWRFLPDGNTEDYVINYGAAINLESTTILDDKINITGTVTLTPNPVVRNPTWNTIGSTFINGNFYTRWFGTNVSWNNIRQDRLTNTLATLPVITGTISGSIQQDVNGVFTGSISFIATEGQYTVKGTIGLQGTLPSNIEIINPIITMEGKYTATFDRLVGINLNIVDNKIVGSLDLELYTSLAKKYRRCDQIMLLTSYGNVGIEDIEIYNPFDDTLKLEFLEATAHDQNDKPVEIC